MAAAKDISNNFLNDTILWNIASKISPEKWISIGRSLGLDDKAINNVKLSYKDDNPDEKTFQMLKSWREKFPEQCTLQALINVLNQMGMNDTAKKIQEMLPGEGNVNKKNPISVLNELCQSKKWKNPEFDAWIDQTDQTKFLSKVSVNGVEFGPKVASCTVKKEAQKQAALVALYALYKLGHFPENLDPSTIDGFYTDIEYQQAILHKGAKK